MARRRRHYGGSVSVDLGNLMNLGRSVTVKDVLLGVLGGVVGAGLAGYGVRWWNANKGTTFLIPDFVVKAAPLLGGVGAGLGAIFLRKNKGAAFGNLVGAAGVGAALAAIPLLADQVSFLKFSDAVSINLPYGGLLVDDSSGESDQQLARYGGLLVDDEPQAIRGYADHPSMGRLAAMSLDPDEDYSEVASLASFAELRELDVEGQG